MLPREFRRRIDAHRRREQAAHDAAWNRALLITNHLRTLINKPMAQGQKAGRLKPLDLDRLKRAGDTPQARREAGTRAEFAALCESVGVTPPQGTSLRPPLGG